MSRTKITKQDLKNLSADYMKVQDLKRMIEDIRQAGATQQFDSVPRSTRFYHDVMADKVAKLNEYNDEYFEAVLQYSEHNREVLRAIEKLENRFYEVIHFKYFENMNYKQIARRMNYSESNVRKLHDKALILLEQQTV